MVFSGLIRNCVNCDYNCDGHIHLEGFKLLKSMCRLRLK